MAKTKQGRIGERVRPERSDPSPGHAASEAPPVFTVGHSTRTIEQFVELLRGGQVAMVVDIRSIPRSRTNPQFNLDALLRGDIKSRYEAYQIAVGGNNGPGWMSRNEVRILEDMNPEEGLDEIYTPAPPAEAKPAEEPKQAKKQPQDGSIAKAVLIERERMTDDAAFHAWAEDYFSRMGKRNGTDYAMHLNDLYALGAEAAVAKWSAENA